MKITTTALLLLSLVIFTRCGEEGVGVNIGKEFPLEVPVDLPAFGPTPTGFNPPPFTLGDTYSIDKVDAFSNDEVAEIAFKSIKYGIIGVDANEDIGVSDLTLKITIGSTIITLPISSDFANGKLQNLPKSAAIPGIDGDQIAEILKNGGSIGADATFDFDTTPAAIDFKFVFYFDIVVKARDKASN
jgi:hypothetical protein